MAKPSTRELHALRTLVERIWYESAVPVFLERFILPALATVLVGVILLNPLKLDRQQQGSLLVAVVALAYFIGHTVYKTNQAKLLEQAAAPATRPEPSAPEKSEIVIPLPTTIREDMDLYQIPTLRELIRQVGVDEMWLSQVVTGLKDGTPLPGNVDYPSALKRLAENGEVEILETVSQRYPDFWQEHFDQNIRFRVLQLAQRQRPKRRGTL